MRAWNRWRIHHMRNSRSSFPSVAPTRTSFAELAPQHHCLAEAHHLSQGDNIICRATKQKDRLPHGSPVLLWVEDLSQRNTEVSRRPQEESLSDSSQSLLELVQTTACIDKLLLAGVEGVALGADFNAHLAALGGARNDSLTACALDDALNVLGMDSVLHFHIPLTWNFPICLDMGYKSLYIIAQTPHKCKRFLKFFLGIFHKIAGIFLSSLWLCGESRASNQSTSFSRHPTV